jgi:hypothetical protein
MPSPAVPPAVCYPSVLARSLGDNVTSVATPVVRARADTTTASITRWSGASSPEQGQHT